MKVTMDKKFQTEVAADKVWEYLRDPNKVVDCVPGAKITEQIDETTFEGTVTVKLGPVVTNFKGQVKIERLDDDSRELELTGKGMDSKGTGRAEMKMKATVTALENGKTEVASSMELTISGRMAQFGTRMIGDVNNQMFKMFTENLNRNLQSDDQSEDDDAGESVSEANSAAVPPPNAQELKALPLMLTVFKNMISRFFQRLVGRSVE